MEGSEGEVGGRAQREGSEGGPRGRSHREGLEGGLGLRGRARREGPEGGRADIHWFNVMFVQCSFTTPIIP